MTPVVHDLRFAFSEAQAAAFPDEAGVSGGDQRAHEARTVLPPAVGDEPLGDPLGTTKAPPIG